MGINHKSLKIIVMLLLNSTFPLSFEILSPSMVSPELKVHGELGDEIANNSDVYNCIDPAFTFIGCDWWIEQGYFANIEYPGAIVILGLGLTVDQWRLLETPRENGFQVDIVKYITKSYYSSQTEEINEFGDIGQDDLNGLLMVILAFMRIIPPFLNTRFR